MDEIIDPRGREILYDVKSVDHWALSSSHILCSYQRSDLQDFRYQVYTSFEDLLISGRHSNEIPLEEDAIM
jgi:hypothetical protein